MIVLFAFYVDSISINAATVTEITCFCPGRIWGWVWEISLAWKTPGILWIIFICFINKPKPAEAFGL